MGGPKGEPVSGTAVPPSLRGFGPLANDLHPAAAAVAPVLEEWRHELSSQWGRPVMVTGSGPTLFAFFVDAAEAAEALTAIPPGARAAEVAEPVPFGWAARDESGLWSHGMLPEPSSHLAESLFDG